MGKGLKALDIIANYQVIIDYEKDETSTIQEQLPNSCNIIEKELKALEIIKNKKTNIAMLFWYFKYKPNYEKYVEAFNELSNDYNEEMLTQEEYEFLKEVLCYEIHKEKRKVCKCL